MYIEIEIVAFPNRLHCMKLIKRIDTYDIYIYI